MVVHHLDYLVDRLDADRGGLERILTAPWFHPCAIKDPSGLPRPMEAMRVHGFDHATLWNLAVENWLVVFRLTWR